MQTLSIGISSKTPPNEFRIFRAGKNETTQGAFIFDERAAASVMMRYRTRAVDIQIDLEHLSLDSAAPNFDPDARGWCKLEVRNGELWAVNVRWTADGAARLTSGRQRYISPAFTHDKEGRVIEIFNVAIVANPATCGTPALVAASARNRNRTLGLSARELALAKKVGCTPQQYAEKRRAIRSKSTKKAGV